MSNTPNIILKIIDLLKENNHTCYFYNGLTERLEWCNKDICENIEIEKINSIKNNESMMLVEYLKKRNHKCVLILETYPIQVRWCNNNECIYKI